MTGGNVCADIRTTIIVSSVVGAVTLVGLFFLFHFIRLIRFHFCVRLANNVDRFLIR